MNLQSPTIALMIIIICNVEWARLIQMMISDNSDWIYVPMSYWYRHLPCHRATVATVARIEICHQFFRARKFRLQLLTDRPIHRFTRNTKYSYEHRISIRHHFYVDWLNEKVEGSDSSRVHSIPFTFVLHRIESQTKNRNQLPRP